MSKFYYHLKATHDENVGEIEADSKDAALEKLTEIYAPNNPRNDKAHKRIEINIITEKQYTTDKDRIEKERKAQAES